MWKPHESKDDTNRSVFQPSDSSSTLETSDAPHFRQLHNENSETSAMNQPEISNVNADVSEKAPSSENRTDLPTSSVKQSVSLEKQTSVQTHVEAEDTLADVCTASVCSSLSDAPAVSNKDMNSLSSSCPLTNLQRQVDELFESVGDPDEQNNIWKFLGQAHKLSKNQDNSISKPRKLSGVPVRKDFNDIPAGRSLMNSSSKNQDNSISKPRKLSGVPVRKDLNDIPPGRSSMNSSSKNQDNSISKPRKLSGVPVRKDFNDIPPGRSSMNSSSKSDFQRSPNLSRDYHETDISFQNTDTFLPLNESAGYNRNSRGNIDFMNPAMPHNYHPVPQYRYSRQPYLSWNENVNMSMTLAAEQYNFYNRNRPIFPANATYFNFIPRQSYDTMHGNLLQRGFAGMNVLRNRTNPNEPKRAGLEYTHQIVQNYDNHLFPKPRESLSSNRLSCEYLNTNAQATSSGTQEGRDTWHPYNCPICSEGFMDTLALELHIRTHIVKH